MSEAFELRVEAGGKGKPLERPVAGTSRVGVFLALAEECRPEIEAMARSALGPRLRIRIESSDVLQEALAAGAGEFGRYFPSGTPPRAHFIAWFGAVLRFRAQMLARWHLNAQRRDPQRERRLDSSQGSRFADTEARTASSLAMERERNLAVQEALDQLPEKWRTFVRLVYFEGLRVGEAGRRLDWKPQSAHAVHWKILQRLGNLLRASREGS
jgi:RNA polymerase sigma-70 factor, ECF subfamily